MLRASFLVISLLVLGACGGGGSACKTSCDCPVLAAPSKCIGEWSCIANACAYDCKPACELNTVYTCSADDECNGFICSSRQACK